ncbi:MAG: precorrin-6y C5,15-methyltransferase (decarboxylating) subunit CbiE [Chloroflexota bacterium]
MTQSEEPFELRKSNRILVIGMSAGGAESLPQVLLTRIHDSDLLVGGRRHLSYFDDFSGQRMAIGANIAQISQRLFKALQMGEKAVVLASGDPLCYGIGSTLLRTLPAEALEILPAPTAFQLAFSSLHEPWHDAAFLSAHARPVTEVVQQVRLASKAAILTDPTQTPAVIAQALLDNGLAGSTPCAICENLGGKQERIVRTTLEAAAKEVFADLNVFVVWPERAKRSGITLGLPDEVFETSRGQITKREIRLLAIAELAVQPGHVVWDIGAGSGSVGIEIARSWPTARVYAVEKRAEFVAHIQTNLQRHHILNLQVIHGSAPETCAQWPAPNAVFVGGSGGHLGTIIEVIRQRLEVGGKLVCNLATLENLARVRKLLPDAQVNQIQINRGVPIGEMMRLQPLNPVLMVKWAK